MLRLSRQIKFVFLASYLLLFLATNWIFPYTDSRWGQSIGLSSDSRQLLIGAINRGLFRDEPRLTKMLELDLDTLSLKMVATDREKFSDSKLIDFDKWKNWGESKNRSFQPYVLNSELNEGKAPENAISAFEAVLQFAGKDLMIKDERKERDLSQKSASERVPLPESAEVLGFANTFLNPYSFASPYFVVVFTVKGDKKCSLFKWDEGQTQFIHDFALDNPKADSEFPIIRIIDNMEILLIAEENHVTIYSLRDGSVVRKIATVPEQKLCDVTDLGLLQFERATSNDSEVDIVDAISGQKLFSRQELTKIHELEGNSKIRLLVLELPNTKLAELQSEIVALNRDDLAVKWTRPAQLVEQLNERYTLDMRYITTSKTKQLELVSLVDGEIQSSVLLPSVSIGFHLAAASTFVGWAVVWLLFSGWTQTSPTASLVVAYLALTIPVFMNEFVWGYSAQFILILMYTSTSLLSTALSISLMRPISWLPRVRFLFLVIASLAIFDGQRAIAVYALTMIVTCQLLAWIKVSITKASSTNANQGVIEGWVLDRKPRLADLIILFVVFVSFTHEWYIYQLFTTFFSQSTPLVSLGFACLILADLSEKRQRRFSILFVFLILFISANGYAQSTRFDVSLESLVVLILIMTPFLAWFVGMRAAGYQLHIGERIGTASTPDN